MFRYFGYMIEFFTGILLSCFGLRKKRRRIKNINNNNNNKIIIIIIIIIIREKLEDYGGLGI